MNMKNITLNKILVFLLCLMVVVIVFVTAAVMFGGKRKVTWRHTQSVPSEKIIEDKSLTVLGTMRLFCKDSGVILSVWLSPEKQDADFAQEVQDKERKLKAVISSFFSLYTQQELLSMGEQQIKSQILSLMNEQLVLGKIAGIYFDQYIFVS